MPAIRTVLVTLVVQREVHVATNSEFDLPIAALEEARKKPLEEWHVNAATTEVMQ